MAVHSGGGAPQAAEHGNDKEHQRSVFSLRKLRSFGHTLYGHVQRLADSCTIPALGKTVQQLLVDFSAGQCDRLLINMNLWLLLIVLAAAGEQPAEENL